MYELSHSIKRERCLDQIKIHNPTISGQKETHFKIKDTKIFKVKECKRYFRPTVPQGNLISYDNITKYRLLKKQLLEIKRDIL